MHRQQPPQDSQIESRGASAVDGKTGSEPEKGKRRVFRWSKEARGQVREYLQRIQPGTDPSQPSADLKLLVTQLASATGYPREACLRFVRQAVTQRVPARLWTEEDEQRLLDLSARCFLREVARLMGRSYSSVRSKLHHLGATSQMGRDWFTLYSLAEALHIDAKEVQRWIDRKWLHCRIVPIGELKRVIISANDFQKFCKLHGDKVVGRRISWERLEFIRMFVFPPSHAELLPVRDSRIERSAYDEQNRSPAKIRPVPQRDEPLEDVG